jgi:hypothetical protein
MNHDDDNNMPFLQRLLDRPFLLLAIGMGVMLLFYTGWGFVELALLPQATLP